MIVKQQTANNNPTDAASERVASVGSKLARVLVGWLLVWFSLVALMMQAAGSGVVEMWQDLFREDGDGLEVVVIGDLQHEALAAGGDEFLQLGDESFR